jgi:dephospho-CoA kinase
MTVSRRRLPLIGLTGASGAGKTLVADIFCGLGCFCIEADRVARDLTLPGSPVTRTLARHFGQEILRDDGSLDRRLLASLAFRDEKERLCLNALTHPPICAEIRRMIAHTPQGSEAVVLDGAALPETDLYAECDARVLVYADEETRCKRIAARDTLLWEEVRLRVCAQRMIDYGGITHKLRNEGDSVQDLTKLCEEVLSDAKKHAHGG